LASRCTKARVAGQRAAASTPEPPATTSVVIAFADLKSRAIISTPEDERTAPDVSASTRSASGLPLARAAISNTQIRPAASSNWKSGKIRMPIMTMSESEGNTPFWTGWHHAILRPSSPALEVLMAAPLQIGLLVFPHVTQLDFTGPLQVFANVPGAKLHLI